MEFFQSQNQDLLSSFLQCPSKMLTSITRNLRHSCTARSYTTSQLFINGEFVNSKSTEYFDVLNPADTTQIVTRTPLATPSELTAATTAAQNAFDNVWRDMPITGRQNVMFNLQALIKRDMDEIAAIIVAENGKTMEDARGDVFRGLQVVEQACSISGYMLGDTLGNLAGGGAAVDTHTYRQPLGVVAGICPFNFPAMIPLWMIPTALTTGNTMVMKPSERTPGATLMLAKLLKEAGLPDGVFNVIHGTHDAVNYIIEEPKIRAISFVGSNQAGEYIHDKATQLGKRVQANLGAKNHATILPDADKDACLNGMLGAAFGAAGQRCMALSTAIFVGDSKEWIPDLAERAAKLNVGHGNEDNIDLGPVISSESKERIHRLIEAGINDGAELILDGRSIQVKNGENGNFVGKVYKRMERASCNGSTVVSIFITPPCTVVSIFITSPSFKPVS